MAMRLRIVIITVLLLTPALYFEISQAQQDSNFAELIAPGPKPWLQVFKPIRQRYVSPTGDESGENVSRPMSFTKAIKSAKAGDLIWMLKGTYTGRFELSKKGRVTAPIVIRALPGNHVIINGGIRVNGAYTWIWGLEITDPKGVADAGGGVILLASGGRAINNVIHGQLGGVGIAAWDHPGQVVYGNIVYTQIPNSDNPHNLYGQNDFKRNGYKYVVNNMLLDAENATTQTFNFHAYTENGSVSGFDVEKT